MQILNFESIMNIYFILKIKSYRILNQSIRNPEYVNMSLFENRSLALSRDNLCHVMTEYMADCFGGFDQFHGFISSLL